MFKIMKISVYKESIFVTVLPTFVGLFERLSSLFVGGSFAKWL